MKSNPQGLTVGTAPLGHSILFNAPVIDMPWCSNKEDGYAVPSQGDRLSACLRTPPGVFSDVPVFLGLWLCSPALLQSVLPLHPASHRVGS